VKKAEHTEGIHASRNSEEGMKAAPCLPGFGMSLPCFAEAPSDAEGEAEGRGPALSRNFA